MLILLICGRRSLDENIASELAPKARSLGGLSNTAYTARQAAYDIKKLRGMRWVQRKGNSRRYEPLPVGLRAMAAPIVIRDDAIKPLAAAQCGLKPGRRPTQTAPIDAH
jgi:hypothetical protein